MTHVSDISCSSYTLGKLMGEKYNYPPLPPHFVNLILWGTHCVGTPKITIRGGGWGKKVIMGTWLSSFMLDKHIPATARSAFWQLCLMRQLHHFLEKDFETVTRALVILSLDYCNTLYVGPPLETSRKLQLMQNTATHMLIGTNKFSHVTHILWEFHWLTSFPCPIQSTVLGLQSPKWF